MKIDHIALYCLDLEGMRHFFMEHFSCRSNEMYYNPRTGLKTYILSFSDGVAIKGSTVKTADVSKVINQ